MDTNPRVTRFHILFETSTLRPVTADVNPVARGAYPLLEVVNYPTTVVNTQPRELNAYVTFESPLFPEIVDLRPAVRQFHATFESPLLPAVFQNPAIKAFSASFETDLLPDTLDTATTLKGIYTVSEHVLESIDTLDTHPTLKGVSAIYESSLEPSVPIDTLPRLTALSPFVTADSLPNDTLDVLPTVKSIELASSYGLIPPSDTPDVSPRASHISAFLDQAAIPNTTPDILPRTSAVSVALEQTAIPNATEDTLPRASAIIPRLDAESIPATTLDTLTRLTGIYAGFYSILPASADYTASPVLTAFYITTDNVLNYEPTNLPRILGISLVCESSLPPLTPATWPILKELQPVTEVATVSPIVAEKSPMITEVQPVAEVATIAPPVPDNAPIVVDMQPVTEVATVAPDILELLPTLAGLFVTVEHSIPPFPVPDTSPVVKEFRIQSYAPVLSPEVCYVSPAVTQVIPESTAILNPAVCYVSPVATMFNPVSDAVLFPALSNVNVVVTLFYPVPDAVLPPDGIPYTTPIMNQVYTSLEPTACLATPDFSALHTFVTGEIDNGGNPIPEYVWNESDVTFIVGEVVKSPYNVLFSVSEPVVTTYPVTFKLAQPTFADISFMIQSGPMEKLRYQVTYNVILDPYERTSYNVDFEIIPLKRDYPVNYTVREFHKQEGSVSFEVDATVKYLFGVRFEVDGEDVPIIDLQVTPFLNYGVLPATGLIRRCVVIVLQGSLVAGAGDFVYNDVGEPHRVDLIIKKVPAYGAMSTVRLFIDSACVLTEQQTTNDTLRVTYGQ